MFEEIQQSVERAKKRRLEALTRFHIGDVVYPLYQTWSPTIWGTVTDIGVVTRKITININGVERQYDPEELVLTNPELQVREPNQKAVEVAEKLIEEDIKKSVKNAMNRTASVRDFDQKLFLIKSPSTAYSYIMKKIEPVSKGVKRDTGWQEVRRVEKTLQDLGLTLEYDGVDDSHYEVDGGSKYWNYTVSFENIAGKKIVLELRLAAAACGTVDDPWGAYDITLMLRRGQLKNASIVATYDSKLFSDVQDDNHALDLTISSMTLLYHYLSVHLSGKNKNPWKDYEISNSRNEIRRILIDAKSREVKDLLNDVLDSFSKIKNEKASLEAAIDRLKKIAPKVSALKKEKQKIEEEQREEWRKQKNASKNLQ